MPKYMVQASYTVEGMKGLIRDGGSKRRAVVEKLVSSAGGRLESMYFTFGDSDVVLIIDMPDNVSAAAISLAVGARGSVSLKSTPLLTIEEVDAACKKPVTYSPPGA